MSIEDTYGDITRTFEMYFEHKVSQACLPDKLESDLWDKVEDFIDKVKDKAWELDMEIDNDINDFDEMVERKLEQDDIRTQEYLERNLFEEAM